MAELNLEQGLEVLNGRTKWAGRLLIAYICGTVAYSLVEVGQLTGNIDLDDGSPISVMSGLSALFFSVTLFASIPLVAMWIYRAHANVRAADIPLEISPGWAVGWFFVPFANLFKPYQAMRELWNASHNMADGYTQDSDPKLKLWWGFWIVSNIITNIAARSMFSGGATGAQASITLDLAGGLLSIPAAWFLLQIVREVDGAQRSTLAAASTFA